MKPSVDKRLDKLEKEATPTPAPTLKVEPGPDGGIVVKEGDKILIKIGGIEYGDI